MLDKVWRADIRPPSVFRSELHPALEALVMRAMAKDPADRYSSVRELFKEGNGLLL